MHKIEYEMYRICCWGDNRASVWEHSNTRVEEVGAKSYCTGGSTFVVRKCEVYLHGNHIATTFCNAPNWPTKLITIPNMETLRRYPTRTTCSRLRALGVRVRVVRGEPIVDRLQYLMAKQEASRIQNVLV